MKENSSRQIRYHIIFWLVYVVLWGARDLVYYHGLISNIVLNMVFNLAVAPFIYFNLLYLVPRFLLKKKLGQYALFFGLTFICMVLVRYFIYQFIFLEVLNLPEKAEQFASGNGIVIITSENMVLVMITMALYLIQEYFIKDRYARELEQKNMESELSILKSQLQPHFLFNNLNTIYFLMETNPELAKEVMISFSDVLSHQLYNAKKDKVPLKEELESLENFLKIQQVRHEDFLDLKYTFPSSGTAGLKIAPMILLTFIENAFKHGQKEEGYFIDIKVDLNGRDLHLHVVNSNGVKEEHKHGGIGLENVQRRLSLIYPDRHNLSTEKTEDTHIVDLTMTLESENH